jgi:hypothetical protein
VEGAVTASENPDLRALDQREAKHYSDLADTLAALRKRLGDVQESVQGQAEVIGGLKGLDKAVADLAGVVTALVPPDGPPNLYKPVNTVRWPELGERQREDALDRLREWVDHIYRPNYGRLAGKLAACWEGHPFCLIQLDWTSELWRCLWLSDPRSVRLLDAQAEFSARLLPAIADQMAAETNGCRHQKAAAGRNGGAGGVWP